MKTLIVGLGNPILTDDGVGVKVAHAIEEALRHQKFHRDDITITEACVGGLRLMELMIGYERVILIDAIMQRNGKNHPPGTIYRMSTQDLRNVSPTQHSASAHDTTLATALEMAERIGLPLPKEVIIFAIEVKEVLTFSDRPTPAVSKAIPTVTEMVLKELRVP